MTESGVSASIRRTISIDVEEHTLRAMMNIVPDKVLRLTMLMHDFGKPDVKKVVEGGREIFYKHPEVSAAYAEKIMPQT